MSPFSLLWNQNCYHFWIDYTENWHVDGIMKTLTVDNKQLKNLTWNFYVAYENARDCMETVIK